MVEGSFFIRAQSSKQYQQEYIVEMELKSKVAFTFSGRIIDLHFYHNTVHKVSWYTGR